MFMLQSNLTGNKTQEIKFHEHKMNLDIKSQLIKVFPIDRPSKHWYK